MEPESKDGPVENGDLASALSASAPASTPAQASPPRIVAVCGGSCSGKSTIATKLATELNGGQNDCKAICADDFFVFDQYLTDNCPTKCIGGHVWKDWESTASIDWKGLVQAVRQAVIATVWGALRQVPMQRVGRMMSVECITQSESSAAGPKAAQAPSCPPYVVVEGFLLLATPECRGLFDAAIMVGLSKEECWRRRRGRAESMAHLPPGLSNSDDERNYEVLETYLLSTADPAGINAEAVQRYPGEGNYAWLRMYFEEVIWPVGLEQEAAFADASGAGMPVLRLDGDAPVGKEQWQEARFPEALGFLRQAK